MQRRHFVNLGVFAAAGLALGKILNAEETCTPISPYISRCTAGIPSDRLPIPVQRASEWCWAACIEMVFGYYGHVVRQERIVKETWGSIVNMPGQPGQILADLNRNWRDDENNGFNVEGDAFTANASTAVIDLRADRPLIIGTLGHAMVLTALTSDVNRATGAGQVIAATVRDPWPGRGKRILTPQEWYNINFAARIVTEDDN